MFSLSCRQSRRMRHHPFKLSASLWRIALSKFSATAVSSLIQVNLWQIYGRFEMTVWSSMSLDSPNSSRPDCVRNLLPKPVFSLKMATVTPDVRRTRCAQVVL